MVTHIGRRVEKLRQAHGESLRDAAARTGVSHTTIRRIELGEVTESFNRTLLAIANGYGVPVEWIHTGKNPPEDFDTQLRLHAVGQATAKQAAEYVPLIRKAADAGLSPRLLSMAIDVMIQQHRQTVSQVR
jgi:transcriptional regulator with XRE-family HTH domain